MDSFQIKFNKKFYNTRDVRNAAKAFHEMAHFKIQNMSDGCVVTITDFDSGIREKLEGEFCNYIFHLSKM